MAGVPHIHCQLQTHMHPTTGGLHLGSSTTSLVTTAARSHPSSVTVVMRYTHYISTLQTRKLRQRLNTCTITIPANMWQGQGTRQRCRLTEIPESRTEAAGQLLGLKLGF